MGRPRSVGASGGRLTAIAAAACAALIAAVGACSSDVNHPPVWSASLANDSDATYLVTINQSSSAMAVPPHSQIDLGGGSHETPKELTIYSTACREVGVVVLSIEAPQAYIEQAGTVKALASNEVLPVNVSMPGAAPASGFTCAEGGWQVVVRNDLATEVYLRWMDSQRDAWFKVVSDGRAPLTYGVQDPFPEGLTVEVYSAGCQLLGSVHPTPDQNVVHVAGSDVSLLGVDDFWAGLAHDNLTWGLPYHAPSACVVASASW